jgi:hypothetical protein
MLTVCCICLESDLSDSPFTLTTQLMNHVMTRLQAPHILPAASCCCAMSCHCLLFCIRLRSQMFGVN